MHAAITVRSTDYGNVRVTAPHVYEYGVVRTVYEVLRTPTKYYGLISANVKRWWILAHTKCSSNFRMRARLDQSRF